MNSINEDEDEDLIELALTGIEVNDLNPPLWFGSACSYHNEPRDAWEEWENAKCLREDRAASHFWQKILRKAFRRLKLEKMQRINSLYCNKSTRNYNKWKKRYSD